MKRFRGLKNENFCLIKIVDFKDSCKLIDLNKNPQKLLFIEKKPENQKLKFELVSRKLNCVFITYRLLFQIEW